MTKLEKVVDNPFTFISVLLGLCLVGFVLGFLIGVV